MAKINIAKRHRARRYALQALYQWQFTGDPVSVIEKQFLNDKKKPDADFDYFHDLICNIPNKIDEIDAAFKPFLDREKHELNPVELAILRMASYELLHHLEIPYKVVINEALELAKAFGAVEGYKYVNGVIDKVARAVRTVELKNA